MNRRPKDCLFLVLFGLLPVLATCGDREPTAPASRVTTVEVRPPSAELVALGSRQDFDATARDQDGNRLSRVSFSWSVSPDSVASVSTGGTARARANGRATVEAEVGGVSGSAELTVEQKVASVQVSPEEAEVDAVGDTVRFSAEPRDGNDHPVLEAGVSWESTDAAVVTVDSTGLATARSEGTARVLARSSGAVDSASLSAEQAVASVTVSPDSAALTSLQDTRDFDVEVVDANGNPVAGESARWSSTDTSVAAVDSAGRAVARGNGRAGVVAEAMGVADTADLTVDQQVASVTVSPDSAALTSLQSTQEFDAELADANGNPVAGESARWSSTDTSVAAVDSVGRAVARGNGRTRVVAEAMGVADTADLTVDQEVGSVRISPDRSVLTALGESHDFDAELADANGNPVSDESARWSSTDTSVAAVDSVGRAVARGNGRTRVVAEAMGVADTADLTVDQQAVSVAVSPDSAALTALQGTQDFDAELVDANGHPMSDGSARWTSTDTSVATVDTAGRAVSRGNGRARVVAEAAAVADTADLTVDQQVASVDVSPNSAELFVLQATQDFDAEVADANGHPVAGASTAWSSSNVTVATVDAEGRAVAEGAGRARIRAEADGVADGAELTLWASSVEVTPAADTVEVGGGADFDATARDANGQELTGAGIDWRSLATDVATVSSTGGADGESVGEAGIAATARGGAADTARLVVEEEEEQSGGGDADLEAVELDFRPTGLLTSETATAELTVRNDGGAVDSYDWRVLEEGTVLASGTESDPPPLDTIEVSGLGPFTRGVHVLTLDVDPDDEVAETDEGNNRAEAPLDSRGRGFRIETELVGGVSGRVRSEVPDAADRWESVVTGDLRTFDPAVLAGGSLDLESCYDGEEEIEDRTAPIDDLLILVREDSIDGDGGVVARAGPCWLRSPADPDGELAAVPLVGRVTMDRADVDASSSFVEEVLAHEYGHALGLVFGPDVTGQGYTGASGVARYHAAGGTEETPPMDDSPHWEEATFGDELMTPFLDVPGQLSVVTVGALADRSYAVDFSSSDGFTLSDLAAWPPTEGRAVGDDVSLPDRVYVVDVRTGAVRELRTGVEGGGSP